MPAHVCRNLYETELSLLVDPDYMENHGPDYQPKMYIDQSMRMIVISWLVEVACEYELHQETLFLATALLDRFMSVAKVGNAILCAVRHAVAATAHGQCSSCEDIAEDACAVSDFTSQVQVVTCSQ